MYPNYLLIKSKQQYSEVGVSLVNMDGEPLQIHIREALDNSF